MVQAALHLLTTALGSLLSLLVPLGLLLAALLLALLLVGLLDRARFTRTLDALGRRLPALGRWGVVAAALGAGVLALTVARHAVDLRLAAQQSARYANAADPDGGQTVQAAPRAATVEDRTYTRTLTLPRDLYARINVQNGWEALLPYLHGADGANVQDLREGFVRQGAALVYARQVTLRTEQPVALDTSAVRADLKFVDPAGGRGTYYNAVFTGEYTFRNPSPDPAVMRFAFPLPTGSGTLSDFRLTVNGRAFRASDLTGGSVWEGEVPGGAGVRVTVTYRNQGARSWSYQLAGRREPVRAFDLTVNADRPAKVQRYALFPIAQTGQALTGRQTLTWRLRDVITAQDVAVVFTQGSLRETLGKVGFAAPAALLLLLGLSAAWAWTRRLPLAPLGLAAALLGLGLGFVLGSVLTAYLPPLLALPLGGLTGAVLGALALGPALRVPALIAAAVPLAFLSGGHAGLLVTALALLTLVLLLPGLKRAGTA